MRLQLRVFRIDHERTSAQLRRDSFLLIPIGAILVIISSALLALALGTPIPADWLPSSITVDPQPNEQGVSVGAALFACFVLVFGLVTMCEGLWRLLLGKVNSLLLRSMLVLGALFIVGGFIASGVLGRRFPSLNSNESLPAPQVNVPASGIRRTTVALSPRATPIAPMTPNLALNRTGWHMASFL